MATTRPRQRVTIKDVAREAGVSVATASEALNGKGRVAQRTREHVIETATVLGYSASRSAKNLNAGRTGALVLAFSNTATGNGESFAVQTEWDIEFFVRILSGASSRAFQRGYLLSMIPFDSSSRGFLSSTDGMILVDPSEHDPLLDLAAETGSHCVTVGRNTRALSWVDNDFFAATTEALDHLRVSHPARPALFLSETSSLYVREELSAYLDWCSNAGIEPTIIRSAGERMDEAQPVIGAALAAEQRGFDAIVTTLDTLAVAAERAADDLGLRVPEDLQILSLADSRYLAVGFPKPITALDLSPAELGEIAVDLLVAEIEGEAAHTQRLVGTSLIIRESTLRS